METARRRGAGSGERLRQEPLLTWEVKANPGPRGTEVTQDGLRGEPAGQGTPGRQMGRREGERDRRALSVVTKRALSRIRVTGRPVHGAGRCHAGHGATGRHSKT